MKDQYYIQNGYVGNAVLWWAKNSEGYTTDIKKAGKYSKQQAMNICVTRANDQAWPCDYIDNNEKAKTLVVDSQYLDHNKLLVITN